MLARFIAVFVAATAAAASQVVAALVAVSLMSIWGFPKIRGTILGFPIIRTLVY